MESNVNRVKLNAIMAIEDTEIESIKNDEEYFMMLGFLMRFEHEKIDRLVKLQNLNIKMNRDLIHKYSLNLFKKYFNYANTERKSNDKIARLIMLMSSYELDAVKMNNNLHKCLIYGFISKGINS